MTVLCSLALCSRRSRAGPSPVQAYRAVDPPCRLTIRQPGPVSNKNGVKGPQTTTATKTAGHKARSFPRSFCLLRSVAARAEQLQQHHEQVDEVEIQPERAHDGRLGCGLAAGIDVIDIHLLDLLRVPGGQPDKHDDADHRDREL